MVALLPLFKGGCYFVKVLSENECAKVSAGNISSDPFIIGVGAIGIFIFIFTLA